MIVELLNDIIVYSKMWLEFHTSSELSNRKRDLWRGGQYVQ